MKYSEYVQQVSNNLKLLNKFSKTIWICTANELCRHRHTKHSDKLHTTIQEMCRPYIFITTPLPQLESHTLKDQRNYAYRQYILRRIIGQAKLEESKK